MKLYHVWRTDKVGYDEYDSWIVCAPNTQGIPEVVGYTTIIIQPIGEAYPETEEGIVLGSFNAG